MRGNDFRLRFCWRLVLLFLIGNLNAAFFTAEVLVLYSLVGFILPLTCRLKDKWVLILAGILLIQPLPLYYVIRATLDPSFVTPAIPKRSYWDATFAMQMNGNFWETLKVNLWEGQLASATCGVFIFIIQWAFCRWWMDHHKHGPLEYLWKKATWIGK